MAMVIAVAGCQSSPNATPATTFSGAATTPPAAPTASPFVAATPPAATGAVAGEVAGIFGVIPPGRYTHRGFEPRITFEVDGPWRSTNALEDFFDIQQLVGSPDVIAVQFAKPHGVYGAGGALGQATTAEAAVATLRQNDRIVVVESSDSLIGGLSGKQVTVENPASTAGDRPIVQVPAGGLSISPARRLWIAFFDTPDGLLAIMIGGSVARWDDALAAAEPVLESVTIGE